MSTEPATINLYTTEGCLVLFHNGHLSLPTDPHTTLSSPQHMVIFIIDIQVKLAAD